MVKRLVTTNKFQYLSIILAYLLGGYMKKFALVAIVIVIILGISSCGTLFTTGGSEYRKAVSLYNGQRYAESLTQLTAALSANPEFEEAALLYPTVFTEGTAYYKEIISTNSSIEIPEAADKVFLAYLDIQQLHNVAKKSGRSGLAIENFSGEIEKARINSAELRFKYAQSLEAKGDRNSIIAAVREYELVKKRYAEFPNIDGIIARAVEDATVTVLVVGSSKNENFHHDLASDLKHQFNSNRFVRIIESDTFDDRHVLVSVLDASINFARGNDINYLISVTETKDFEKIRTEKPVLLPSSNPIFDGTKVSVGYSELCKLTYEIYDISTVEVIHADTIEVKEGPYLYEFSYAKGEGVKDLDLNDAGMRSVRYISSTASEDDTYNAIRELLRDYALIAIPQQVADATKQNDWLDYYRKNYNSFNNFVKHESGRELFYAVEVIQSDEGEYDNYYTLGSDIDAAKTVSTKNSAIMNALLLTANDLIKQAQVKSATSSNSQAMEQLGEFLLTFF